MKRTAGTLYIFFNVTIKKKVIFSITHNIVQGFNYFVDAAYGNNVS